MGRSLLKASAWSILLLTTTGMVLPSIASARQHSRDEPRAHSTPKPPKKPAPKRSEPRRSQPRQQERRPHQTQAQRSPSHQRGQTSQKHSWRNGVTRPMPQQKRAQRLVDRRDDRRDTRYGQRDNRRVDRHDGRVERRWDRSQWRRENRYNWRRYRSVHRSIYQLGRYYAPYRGYAYRRLSIGFFLGSVFYGNRYWINDPWSYRLPAVYGPYRWVRYYDDVLLVNIHTGEIVDVIYDFFW